MAPDKILFGTDYPLLHAGRYFKQLDESGPEGGDREKIMGGNGARLLEL